jgi:hypothetical protein
MEQSIKELIELSTSSGSIKQESRDFIYLKAEEKGILKAECDIYIENALNTAAKEDNVIKSEKKSRGWWFIIFGISDILWGASCLGSKYTAKWGMLGILSGLIFTLVGFYFLGRLKAKTFKIILYILGFFTIAYIILLIIGIVLD